MEAIVSPMVIIVGNKKVWHKAMPRFTGTSNVALMTPEQFDTQFAGVDVDKIPNLKIVDLRKYPDLWEDE